ncbi:MAG: type III deoxyribonuclease, partial [Patescibacteria group bacterium]|nr:type III deoxyribonuclease [Patescibacteria group bacterium]
FEPDFLLMLKKNGSKKVAVYQVFIEPKGDQFKDKDGQFELGKEGWKQQFLVEMEKQAEPKLKIQNRNFKIIGLPFYNQSMKQVFEEAFEEKLLS